MESMENKIKNDVSLLSQDLNKGRRKNKNRGSRQEAIMRTVKTPVRQSRRVEETKEIVGRRKLERETLGTLNRVSTVTKLMKPQIEKIALAITVPMLSDGLRWSTSYSSSATAIATPFARSRDNSNSTTTTNGPLPVTDTFCALFRDASCALIQYDSNPGALAMNYSIYGVIGNDTAPFPIFSLAITATSMPLYFLYGLNSNLGGYAPHGNTIFAGGDRETSNNYLWIDIGNTVSFACVQVPTAVFTCTFTRWNSGELIPGLAATLTGPGTVTFTALVSAYYAFSYTQAIGSNSMQATLGGTKGVFGHKCLPGYDVNYPSVSAYRIIGASLMLTNQSSPLNSEGVVAIAQVSQGKFWQDLVVGGTSTIAGLPNSAQFKADKGVYGFLKPTSPNDFNMKTYLVQQNNSIFDSLWPLSRENDYLAIYISCNIPAGRDYFWTSAFNLEYQSTDVWRGTSVPTDDPMLFDKAVNSIKYVPQYHENPLHIKEIWNSIKKTATDVINGIIEYGPKVLAGASAIAALL